MANVFHMNPDLVCPACLQNALHKIDVSKPFDHPVMGDSRFSG